MKEQDYSRVLQKAVDMLETATSEFDEIEAEIRKLSTRASTAANKADFAKRLIDDVVKSMNGEDIYSPDQGVYK